ncbi:MAG TPA: NAD(P)-binding domain-containing protein [Steroidobacteraceae bacterium]|jgi:predicted dinucleotide-binding enzyme|nr:NAD(P)-binding domain-containing protein [Steroidobacteraceae bacterium]
MRIGVLGSGTVGTTLAGGFAAHGHEVMIGSREPAKLADFTRQARGVRAGTPEETAKFAELAVLAVKGSAAAAMVRAAGAANLAGKAMIDVTNPLANAPPVNGVLGFFTSLDESLMERLQKEFPQIRFVKAFNSVGSARMVNPVYAAGKPSMFICGDDQPAKALVSGLLDQLGWETEDMGEVEAARAIEPLCILWCIPGLRQNQWTHAFKLLK